MMIATGMHDVIDRPGDDDDDGPITCLLLAGTQGISIKMAWSVQPRDAGTAMIRGNRR